MSQPTFFEELGRIFQTLSNVFNDPEVQRAGNQLQAALTTASNRELTAPDTQEVPTGVDRKEDPQ